MEETEQDRLRSPESLLLSLKVANRSLFNTQDMRSTFPFWRHVVTTAKLDGATTDAISSEN